KIYKEGYFYSWTEREQLLFSSRVNVDIHQVNAIITDCLRWGLFEQSMYEQYRILTSRGIQKRYIEAAKRRKEITVIKEYALIDPSYLLNTQKMNVSLVSANRNESNSNINNSDHASLSTITPQSKGKES